MTKVFITGLGLISALGKDVSENHQSLVIGQTGLSKNPTFFSSKYTASHPFGEIKLSNEQIGKSLSKSNLKGLTRTDLIAFKAFEEAVSNAGLSVDHISNEETGLISSSTVGGMVLTDRLYNDGNYNSESNEFFSSYKFSSHTQRLINHFKIMGITNTINTACSSSANAIMLGARLIKSSRAKRMIVGGTDSLAKFTVNGFKSLQIMSDELCQPFDQDRKGLNLGEGAAYLVLESADLCQEKEIYGEVLGYGNNNDASHVSSLSENATGIKQAMQSALAEAGVLPENIDYINTHGTATFNNDLSEVTGINSIFKTAPPFNSTKSYTGHTLAASGAIEAVFSLLSMKYGELYPSLNFKSAILPFNHVPISDYQSGITLQRIMSNSFGFGGSCTSLILSRIN